MDTHPETKPSILEAAWRLYAQFDAAAKKRTNMKDKLYNTVAAVSVLATFFAIFSSVYPVTFPAWGSTVVNIILIILPILASTIAAFANKFFPGGDWLILRAGAELVQKEIFQYRTILQKKKRDRRVWLETRLKEIHLQVYNGLNGELILPEYKGLLPPGYDNDVRREDPGFNDLSFEEYYKYRIKDQLDWHVRRVQKLQRKRIFMQVLILVAGAVGTFLAALGNSYNAFSVWVALATAVTTALIGIQELGNFDKIVRNYSRVILELSNVSNHWHNLEVSERTRSEFYKVVEATEIVLWNQFVEYIKSMQEVLAAAKTDGSSDLIAETVEDPEGNDAPDTSFISPLPDPDEPHAQ